MSSRPDVTRLDKVLYGIPNLDRATGGAVMGELSVWTGKRGEGKSTLLDQFLLEAIDQGETRLRLLGGAAGLEIQILGVPPGGGAPEHPRQPGQAQRQGHPPAHTLCPADD